MLYSTLPEFHTQFSLDAINEMPLSAARRYIFHSHVVFVFSELNHASSSLRDVFTVHLAFYDIALSDERIFKVKF